MSYLVVDPTRIASVLGTNISGFVSGPRSVLAKELARLDTLVVVEFTARCNGTFPRGWLRGLDVVTELTNEAYMLTCAALLAFEAVLGRFSFIAIALLERVLQEAETFLVDHSLTWTLKG